MTETEIFEGNKLIAELMGYQIKSYSDTASYGNGDTSYLYSKDGITTDQVFYDSSWDWIMPVVDKIESLGFSVSINNGRCSILFYNNDNYVVRTAYNEDGHFISRYLPEDYDWYALVSEKETITKIESVWKSVIEFIKCFYS